MIINYNERSVLHLLIKSCVGVCIKDLKIKFLKNRKRVDHERKIINQEIFSTKTFININYLYHCL